MPTPLRLLVVGAHPDDAEYKAGGLAALYRALGHEVGFLSLTDGRSGHHEVAGEPLVKRRKAEAAAAAATLGLTYDLWDQPDGRLEPSLACRERLIRQIRRVRPDLVLTHRPNDYHPDHRATSLLVQDAAYLLTVPAICPDVPHLPRDPVIAYLSDDFSRPYPFEPTVIVDVTPVWDAKVAMLHAHTSQFYEWLPYHGGILDEVPGDAAGRLAWLSARMSALSERLAERFRARVDAAYGPGVRLIEAFEGCEYGSLLDATAVARLFPFVPGPEGDAPRARALGS